MLSTAGLEDRIQTTKSNNELENMDYVLFRNFVSNCKCKWRNDIVLLKD